MTIPSNIQANYKQRVQFVNMDQSPQRTVGVSLYT